MPVLMGDICAVDFSYRSWIHARGRLNDAPDTTWVKAGSPITLPWIILCQFCLLLAGNRFFGVDIRAVAYLFPGNADRECSGFPRMVDDGLRRDQNLPG